MAAISRITDSQSGHGPFPPTISSSGSGNVFINGMAVHRVSDTWIPHTYDGSTHSDTTSSGSATVFINSLGVARIGDSTAEGAIITSGSGNVFSG